LLRKGKTMKKIIILTVFFILSAELANAGSMLNYPYVYKGIRSTGMGGTFTAVGKDAEALFYNPAGLYDMGFQLSVLNPLIEVNDNVLDLTSDVIDAMDIQDETERMSALTDLINKNMGEIIHGRLSLFPHVAAKSFALGAVGQGQIDARLHNPLSSQGAVEVQGGYLYGPVTGFSLGIPGTGLRFGAGFKYLFNTWVEENFTVTEIASESIDLEETLIEKADFSLDAGVLYDLPYAEFLKPKIGLGLLDITDLDFKDGDQGRVIPMRVNIGASINPSLVGFMDTIIAIDYQDLTYAYDQDSSFGKRLHVGGELGFLSRHILLRAGLNQGYPALGAELDLWLLRVAYAQYSEEMGAYAGQDKDTRQLVQINIGW